ncbi:hypothetical protein DFS34DRAFT_592441 [Phlyctochytrium arcticum]|nr:hypothetical protein DFS34DRAFT_592441 [Phlyctochytrium arcticum]
MEALQQQPSTNTVQNHTSQRSHPFEASAASTLQGARTSDHSIEDMLREAPSPPRQPLPPGTPPTSQSRPDSPSVTLPSLVPVDSLFEQQAIWNELERLLLLVENVCHFDVNILTPEQRLLWAEIDRLMDLIDNVCAPRQRGKTEPPTYEEALNAKAAPKMVGDGEKAKASISVDELGSVMSAIDRVLQMAPRLNDQAVSLNSRQEKSMSAAALLALIDRLNRGKETYQNQRAVATAQQRFTALQKLVDQIAIAGDRSFSNQRVSLSADQMARMELGRLGGLLDRQEKSRYKNQSSFQDFITRDQMFQNDISKLQADLQRSASTTENTQYAQQRYEMSSTKERDLFIQGLGAKMERMDSRRLGNQDAVSSSQRKDEKFDELDRIMSKFPENLSSQRASHSSADSAAGTPKSRSSSSVVLL